LKIPTNKNNGFGRGGGSSGLRARLLASEFESRDLPILKKRKIMAWPKYYFRSEKSSANPTDLSKQKECYSQSASTVWKPNRQLYCKRFQAKGTPIHRDT